MREEEREKEMLAFAEIDWQDFVVVQTIEFTSTDQTIELPPPTSIKEMERLTLNERKMAADIVEEVGERAQEQQGQADDGEMEIDMEESDDEEIKDRQKKQADEIARAREVQAKAMGQAGMKIRKDYVPKGKLPARLSRRLSRRVPFLGR
jgi:splicing factor 3A subunit 1